MIHGMIMTMFRFDYGKIMAWQLCFSSPGRVQILKTSGMNLKRRHSQNFRFLFFLHAFKKHLMIYPFNWNNSILHKEKAEFIATPLKSA